MPCEPVHQEPEEVLDFEQLIQDLTLLVEGQGGAVTFRESGPMNEYGYHIGLNTKRGTPISMSIWITP